MIDQSSVLDKMIGLTKRHFVLLALLTTFSLFYVHAQISVFGVSYAIAEKEKRLSKLSDEYRNIKFQVSKLKSLNYLDKKRREIDADLVTPIMVKAIRVPAEKPIVPLVEPDKRSLLRHGLSPFLGLMKEAQARVARD